MTKKIPGNFPVVVAGNNREDLAVRQAGSVGYFKKLSKAVFFWDYRHPLEPK